MTMDHGRPIGRNFLKYPEFDIEDQHQFSITLLTHQQGTISMVHKKQKKHTLTSTNWDVV